MRQLTTRQILRLNSPAPLMDDWKVTDNSSVNFHDVFFFIFCQIIAKNEENMSWKFTDELSVTFQSSVSGAGEFGLSLVCTQLLVVVHRTWS